MAVKIKAIVKTWQHPATNGRVLPLTLIYAFDKIENKNLFVNDFLSEEKVIDFIMANEYRYRMNKPVIDHLQALTVGVF